ncbi:MAG TPA: aspartyl protease family protein [Thermoanaerobaculia bacterium]
MRNILRTLLLLSLSLQAAAATPASCWPAKAGKTPTTVQREASFSMGGLQGTIRTWSRADGAYRIETALPAAGYRSVQVYDGKRDWKADGASRAHEVTNLELAEMVTDGLFDSLQASNIAVATDTPNTFTVAPNGGAKVTVVVDPKTCLPRTFSRTTAVGEVTQTIDEWTTVNGHTLPAVIRQSSGNAQYDATVRYTSTKVGEEIAASIFMRPDGGTKVALPNGATYLEVPFELIQHHVYIPVEIAGKTVSFVVDTGAEASVIDAGTAKSLGLTGTGSIEARGNGEQTVSAQPIPKPQLTVAGLTLPLETMYAVPLRALWPREGRALEGILGHDVLSRFVVEVDYAASRVRLHDPERFTPPSGATTLPMTYDGNIPAIQTAFTLPGGRRVEGRMIIDTGNSGGLDLYGPFVEANKIRADLARTVEGAGGMGVGGVSKQDLARIATFEAGPFKLNDPIVTLARDTKGSAAHPELAGNLGTRVLRRFTLFVDYPHDRVLLTPNASFDKPFESDMSGLALIAEGDTFDRTVVRRVLPDTAAASAGLKEGDEIITIDGSPRSLHRIRELFLQPDATYDVRVKRGEETLTIKLTTRRVI